MIKDNSMKTRKQFTLLQTAIEYGNRIKKAEINQYIGSKIKMLRFTHGLTSKDFSKMLNVSMQQINKYEQGMDKVPVTTLYILSKIFKVPIDYFVDGFQNRKNDKALIKLSNEPVNQNVLALRLMRAYLMLPTDIAQTIYKLVLSLAR